MAAISRACRIRNPALFICDIQEKFRPGIHEFAKLINTASKMLSASQHLQMPVYVSTQSRAKLGDTVAELQPYLSSPHVRANIDKTLFSMVTPELEASLATQSQEQGQGQGQTQGQAGKVDAIIVGIETHICVTQTTLDLLERGHRVYVLVDGVSSINPEERTVALARLRDAGAIVTSSESVLFEVLEDAKNGPFKAVSGLVKDTKEETRSALGALARI